MKFKYLHHGNFLTEKTSHGNRSKVEEEKTPGLPGGQHKERLKHKQLKEKDPHVSFELFNCLANSETRGGHFGGFKRTP